MKYKAGEIAQQLGNTLVAPLSPMCRKVMSIRRPSYALCRHDHDAAGCLRQVLEYAARSFKQHGFLDIALVGDSGGNQEGQRLVAQILNKEWASTSVRVHHITAYYPGRGDDWVVSQGVSAADVGSHAGTHDTASLMYINPSMLRVDKLVIGKSGDGQGHTGNPARSTALFGRRILEMQIEDATTQIRELRVSTQACRMR